MHSSFRLENNGRLMDGDQERIGVAAPEYAFPSGQFVMRKVILFRILNTESVGCKLADRDASLDWIVFPDGNVFRGRIVRHDAAIVHCDQERQSADERFGKRCDALALLRAVAGRIPFVGDFAAANDQESGCFASGEIAPQGFEFCGIEACFLGCCGLPVRLRLGAKREGNRSGQSASQYRRFHVLILMFRHAAISTLEECCNAYACFAGLARGRGRFMWMRLGNLRGF